MEKKKKKRSGFVKITLRVLLGFLVLLVLLLLFIRSPWGQDIITGRIVSYLSGKTNTRVAVDRLYITFSGGVSLQGLYLEDREGDTLLYSKALEAEVPVWPLVTGGDIAINRVEWEGLRARIYRKDTVEGFNFQFLIDAFAPEDTTAVEVPDDSGGAGIGINLRNLRFKDFDLSYKDDVSGMDTRLVLGELYLRMKKSDLQRMDFHIADAAIRDTDARYLQTLPLVSEDEPETEETPLPRIVVDNLEITSLNARYESVPDGMKAMAAIADFRLKLPEADLENNTITLDALELSGSDILYESTSLNKDPKDSLNQDITETGKEGFSWPEWRVTAGAVTLEDNHLVYTIDGAGPQPGVFNANALTLDHLTLLINDIYLGDQRAGLAIETFRFDEASGLQLKELTARAGIDEKRMTLDGLRLHLNDNRLDARAEVSYKDLESFFQNPERATAGFDIDNLQLSPGDVFYFQPGLKENPYITALAEKDVGAVIRGKGTLARLSLTEGKVNWGKDTRIDVQGKLSRLAEPDSLGFELDDIRFSTLKKDLLVFVNEEETGISLPDSLELEGKLHGNLQQVSTALDLRSTDGDITFEGALSQLGEKPFEGTLNVTGLALGKLLQNPQLGALSMELKSAGKLREIYDMDAALDLNVARFSAGEISVHELPLTADIIRGEGEIKSAYKDSIVDFDLRAGVTLDSVSPQVIADIDLNGADLHALGVMSMPVKGAVKVHADFKGNAERFRLNSDITGGVAVYDQNSYPLGDLSIKAFADKDTTSVVVRNKMLDLDLHSNVDPGSFTGALQSHFRELITEQQDSVTGRKDTVPGTLPPPARLELKGRLNSAPILSDIFLPGLKELDTVKITADFQQENQVLQADITAPHINYSGSEIDSLLLRLNSANGVLAGHFGFRELSTGPISIHHTTLDASVKDNRMLLDFNAFHQEEKLMGIRTEISRKGDTVYARLDPAELVFDKKQWSIPADNQVMIYPGQVRFSDFVLRQSGQQLELVSTEADDKFPKDRLALRFDNFTLSSLLTYLNPDEPLADGIIDGNIVMADPFGTPGFLAGLNIDSLEVMTAPLGTLKLRGISPQGEHYKMDLSVKGGDLDLDMKGDYTADTGGAVNLEMNLNSLKTSLAEKLSGGEISEPGGSVSGKVEVGGTVDAPQYNGNFNFNDVSFRVNMLNTLFRLPSEKLSLDNEGMTVDHFTIRDENDNTFVIDGRVVTEDFGNPGFDLTLKAENFRALDSERENNDLFYGKAFFDTDARITGNLKMPKIDMQLHVGPDTDVTYIIPESELDVVERDGVVLFVNREDPDDILTRTREESVTLSGMEVKARISLDKKAVFRVVINEKTNDNLEVSGESDLIFNLYPNGRTTLSGKYTLSKGHYELNLYNLVRRRFEFNQGSSITWAGDPLDADLDLRAIYQVKAAASPLMALQQSGDASANMRFRQQLPFLVYLNIEGELMQPDLSFNLDMPEDQQGAIGGQVYGRVQQLNEQEDELNKQVFSLLVFNRFFPASGSDGSGGGAASIARDNLNQALSGQLNALSDKLMGESGVELDFGLDSYTDYQGSSPQERTQLDITARKKLFDDRVVISVGSEVDIQGSNQAPGQENPLIGNVSIEYLLTEDGRYRLKGFRKNEYENVIDGQLIVNGIALIFTREFNRYEELFRKTLQEKIEEEKEAARKKENDKKDEKEEEKKDEKQL
ncbi:translocation/assembly module TamB domain-containing protein [Sinomicrobium soli]|uniref:translocation/assembly module TamB domain-containing protein n=1 Tax=Sinomicrobium sp. N-1-3-6 TaxID=2219864 RepID=UPI000DCC41AA|nr:translocation/assembly module TamB [Sinomicrobium sp. N-1-3-6]RAV28742.1 translocation/assembly module TamB [Sinomicrobium sp. N-1-3-6]